MKFYAVTLCIREKVPFIKINKKIESHLIFTASFNYGDNFPVPVCH